MAIALEFIDFVVPIAVIRSKYPGGWEQCLKDHKGIVGGRLWFDDHLMRDGAMNPNDIDHLVEHWSSLGFQALEECDGIQVWKDFCVVESLFGGATLTCDWLAIGDDGCSAYLLGTEPGIVVGRDLLKVRHASRT